MQNFLRIQEGNEYYPMRDSNLGMGIDIKDVDMVVHMGSPKSLFSYWQEAGRCARTVALVLVLFCLTTSHSL